MFYKIYEVFMQAKVKTTRTKFPLLSIDDQINSVKK